MYYYSLEALTFTQESVLNAKVYTESVLDVLTGSNTSWMGSWAYNTDYQTVIEDAFLKFNALTWFMDLSKMTTAQKKQVTDIFSGEP